MSIWCSGREVFLGVWKTVFVGYSSVLFLKTFELSIRCSKNSLETVATSKCMDELVNLDTLLQNPESDNLLFFLGF